jgi:hypothetical protein
MTIVLTKLIERPDNPFRLGRHQEHDERAWHFPTPWSKPQNISKFWTTAAPILDQGNVGSCTGNTVVDVVNTDLFTPIRTAKNHGNYLVEADALNIYSKGTYLSAIGGGQTYPPDDPGCTGPAVAKAAEDLGLFDKYLHCFNWDQFCATIEQTPVMLGTPWTQQMFDPDQDGFCRVGDINDSTLAGGHEYMGRAIDYENTRVLCRNHWNAQWNPEQIDQKDPGEFWLSFTDLQSLLQNGGDVTVPFAAGCTPQQGVNENG